MNFSKLISVIYSSPLLFMQKFKMAGLAISGNSEHRMKIFLFLKRLIQDYDEVQRKEKEQKKKIPHIYARVKKMLSDETKRLMG